MGKLKTVAILAVALFIVVLLFNTLAPGEDLRVNLDDEQVEQSNEPVVPTGDQPGRENSIPADAVKVTPETDDNPPVLHHPLWEEPVPMPYPINTAGAEDSPFVTPCGCQFFFTYTPDPYVPVEEQIIDGVTGIYFCQKTAEGWSVPVKLVLNDDISLDGCPFVQDDELWFCSAREGNFRGVDFWVANFSDGEVEDIRNAGALLNKEIEVGELHFTSDWRELYFHSDTLQGKGDRDIWVIRNINGEWSVPENVDAVNSEVSDSLPFITQDGCELWFTRWYKGSPAIFRSKKIENGWSQPELIASCFAAEPSLDAEGNLYFAHHFFKDGVMLEADIYVAYRKNCVEPADTTLLPARGFYMGYLPTPAQGQSLGEIYSDASKTVEVIPIWGRPTSYYDLSEELSGSWGALFVQNLTRGNGLIPLIHFSFIDEGLTLKTPPGLESSTLSDFEWRQSYKDAVLEVFSVSQPLFLSVGNEVNRWYEKYGLNSSNGFEHFVSLYEEIYDLVKELSPHTQVFCTFSREVVNEHREADLDVLTLFDPDKLDMLVFTTYPHSISTVNRPKDIPDDYYSRAAEYMTGKPFGFSELSWPSIEAFGGEQGQSDFLTDSANRLTREQGLNLKLFLWFMSTDLSSENPVGLLNPNGTEKIAYSVWLSLSSETG